MRTYQVGAATITVHQEGPWHVAVAKIPTKDGDVTICARASEQLVRRLPVRVRGNRAYVAGHVLPAAYVRGGDEVGGFFDTISKAWRKITRAKAFRTVLSAIPMVTSNPVFSQLAAAVPFAGPALAAAGPFAGPAATMLLKATAGNVKAQKRVKAIVQLAQKGDPEALRAVAAMQGVRAAAKISRRAGPQAQAMFDAAIQHAMKVPRPEVLPEPEPQPAEPEALEWAPEIGAYVARPQRRVRRGPVFGYGV